MALSSITKKLIMSVSGLFLIVFLLLHMTINLFSVIDTFKGTYGAADGLFQAGCDFMALPIVTIMVPVLALGFIVHIVYAGILTAGNINARGGLNRYAGGSKGKAESWASKNMLVLGIVVLGLIAFHLNHFWAEMQLKEFMGEHAENPYKLLEATFQNWWVVVLYIVWFVALGLHLCHGFWSAFQTIGLSNQIWEKRLYAIGYVFVAIIVLGFSVVAVNAFLHAHGFLC
ncbi:MAG: succinate dehydrogenase cytochrome b subunit [Bacteroidales bacterium]|nr:succinate dehydrogenase cytochrome b subunit [Bacteroidales bacterium]